MRKTAAVIMVSVLAAACNAIQNGNKLTVPAGQTRKVAFLADLNADCTSKGEVDSRILTPPQHGRVVMEKALDYPTYAKDNQRYECNTRKVPGVRVMYTPNPGYVGPDFLVGEAIYPSGADRTGRINIEVR